MVPRGKRGDPIREEIAAFDIGSHGLVALRPGGELSGKIPGHQFGKPEVMAVLQALLASP